ncbi:hypothetical protein NIES2107_64170 [Nostoc carneum NIES-2107]|nr:hypothetical protein NIES2107_64170 [Nostoc carneum NIES-2107]
MGKGKETVFNRSADAHGVREQRPAGKPFSQKLSLVVLQQALLIFLVIGQYSSVKTIN